MFISSDENESQLLVWNWKTGGREMVSLTSFLFSSQGNSYQTLSTCTVWKSAHSAF